jgi:hypothetical protein
MCMKEFVSLRSKMCSYKKMEAVQPATTLLGSLREKFNEVLRYIIHVQEKMEAKGVQKDQVEHNIHHKTFLDVLHNENDDIVHKVEVHRIQSRNHNLETYPGEKIGLSRSDSKRLYAQGDHINTYSYGYCLCEGERCEKSKNESCIRKEWIKYTTNLKKD